MGLPDAICLMGNHERMLLSFLEDPDGQGARWIKHGGRETMVSFGITPDATSEQRDALKECIGADGLAWLTSRPLYFQSGNL
jgi:serine/threonine protein phosphatase 1